jgi:hypothetical protein
MGSVPHPGRKGPLGLHELNGLVSVEAIHLGRMTVEWISHPAGLQVSLEGLRGLLELLDPLAKALSKFR